MYNMQMDSSSYPDLSKFLMGYFHQDCYDDGATDEDITNDFLNTSRDVDRLGLISDIHRILQCHKKDLLKALEMSFSLDIVVGENNEEAHQWFLNILRQLEKDSDNKID